MKYDQVNSLNKKKVMETRKFMYFWLNYSNKNNHLKKIPFGFKNIEYLVCMASKLYDSDKLHLLLLSDGTRIDHNGHLKSLETATEVLASAQRKRCVNCLSILI